MAVNKYLGPTGLTELINLIQADFQKKQDWMQFPEMPDATLYHGKVVQFTGITDDTYTKGFFYYSTGLEWVNIAISNAVEVYDTLPPWNDAKAGVIYYVASEGTCYIKGSEKDTWLDIAGTNKSFEIVATLPAYDDADPLIIYMVPAEDGSTVTGYIKDANTTGKFYQLGGGSVKGFELVVTLPTWASADENILYLLVNGTKLAGYVKNVNEAGEFYELSGAAAEPAFEIVDALPAWASASVDKIYFLKDDSKLFGYIKNEAGGWFMFGSSGGIEQVTVLPAWDAADPDILYLVPDENGLLSAYKKDPNTTGKFFELSGNDAITMEDIEDIFEEVFGA